jgi:hypothetical protein
MELNVQEIEELEAIVVRTEAAADGIRPGVVE